MLPYKVPILLLAFDSFVENDLREIYGLSHAKYDTIVTIKRKKLVKIINDLVSNKNSTLESIKKLLRRIYTTLSIFKTVKKT